MANKPYQLKHYRSKVPPPSAYHDNKIRKEELDDRKAIGEEMNCGLEEKSGLEEKMEENLEEKPVMPFHHHLSQTKYENHEGL